MHKKLNKTAKKLKASTCERKIVNDTIKEIRRYFDGESNFWTNQQVLSMRDNFREVVVKSWVAFPLEILNFRVCDKMLVREAVEFYSECRRERCKALYPPEYEKISLNNEIKQIKMMLLKGIKLIMKNL